MKSTPTEDKPDDSVTPINGFVREVATYFMDFLETNFHKRRLPKRNVRYKDANNLPIGINLRKYDNFATTIREAVAKNKTQGLEVEITRGKYTTTVSRLVLDQIKNQIDAVNADSFNEVANQLCKLWRDLIREHLDDLDVSLGKAHDATRELLKTYLFVDLIAKLKTPLEKISSPELDSLAVLEDSLIDILFAPLTSITVEAFPVLGAGQEFPLEDQVSAALEPSECKRTLKSFFDKFYVNDLYFDTNDLVHSWNTLDKQEIYLYLSDITFENHKYPLFYIPIESRLVGDSLFLKADSNIYINKKAIEYIVQEVNKRSLKTGRIRSISERILYATSDENSIAERIQKIIDDLCDYFQIFERIELSRFHHQISKSATISITNNCHLCVFDKSDEALVNDYEELLQTLELTGQGLSDSFVQIIGGFISEEPEVITSEVEREWRAATSTSRLVYESPVSLNSEPPRANIAETNWSTIIKEGVEMERLVC